MTVASTARAEHDDERHPEVADPYQPVTGDGQPEHLRTPMGMAFSLGGGVQNFTGSALNNQTDPGGNWQARLTIGTRSLLAFEGAYIGSANNVNGLGLDDNAIMAAHGAEGLLRLNLGTYAIQPYLFAGGAWKHYSLHNQDNAVSSVAGSDNVLETPLGAGVAFRADGFVLDTRFDYRPSYDEDMFAPIAGQKIDMDNWNATARVGFEF